MVGEDVSELLDMIAAQMKVICYPAGFCAAKARVSVLIKRDIHSIFAHLAAMRLP